MHFNCAADHRQGGFSLITISIIMTVAAVLMVSVLPGQEAGDINLKIISTTKKLGKIEEAMRSFMALNGRRPCPADGQYAIGNTNFGLEAATPGTCTGGTPAAPLVPTAKTISGATQANPINVTATAHGFSVGNVILISGVVGMTQLNGNYYVIASVPDANHFTLNSVTGTAVNSSSYSAYTSSGVAVLAAVAGTIPTRSLGLPDDYAFDEWGRHITYIVDTRATGGTTCQALYSIINSAPSVTGDIVIENTTGGTVLDNTMYAYVSHGPDGFGAYPEQGISTRLNNGSTDADQMTNANVTTGFASAFTNVKVQKGRTSTFDDIVWYRPDIKNTCCLGASCINSSPGFRINGATVSQQLTAPQRYGMSTIAHGDINADGKMDLVIATGSSGQGNGGIYIVWGASSYGNPVELGSATGYPSGGCPAGSATCVTAIYDSNDPSMGASVAVGDINGDGKADIIMCDGGSNCDVIYGAANWNGGSGWPSSINVGASTATCVNTNFTDGAGSGGRMGNPVIADISGHNNGVHDIIIGDYNNTTCTTVPTGTLTFTTNPSNNQTISLGGQTWTFKSSGASGNQTNIQGTLAATLTQLVTDLTASANSKITPASYSASPTVLTVTYKTAGCGGTSYGLGVGTAASARSGSHLSATSVTGGVWVIFGQPNSATCGHSPQIDPITSSPPLDITTLSNSTTPTGTTIASPSSTYQLGIDIAAGDVNGDGLNDLVIATANNAAAFIVAGQTTWPSVITTSSFTGIPAYPANNPVCSSSSTTCGTYIKGIGNCLDGLAVGDFTGDGIADIVLENGNCSYSTDNYLVPGGNSAFTAASYTMGPGSGDMLNVGTAWDYNSDSNNSAALGGSGYESGVGNMIGNVHVKSSTTGDLLFSSPTDGANGGVSTYGSVYVLFGGSVLTHSSSFDVYANPPLPTASPPTGFRIDCPYETNNTCGYALDVADMNGDSINDIIIGVPGGNVTGSNEEGYVYVLFGKTSGWTTPYSLSNIY